jgi:D-alanine-D-alanine ligase
MNIVVLHNAAAEDAAVEERDVLVQRDAVVAALTRLGHHPQSLACTLDLAATKFALEQQQPDLVFNLVESLGGTDRLMCLATLLLEALHVPCTGASTDVLLATSNKLAAKRRLLDAGLPTPGWQTAAGDSSCDWPAARDSAIPSRGIVKCVWEHASLGIDDHCVIGESELARVTALLQQRDAATHRPHFVEQFIDGREFNLSLLAGAGAPQVLPPAEIDFAAWPDDKPRIVGYRAKWDAAAAEFQQTPRRFDFAASDTRLLEQLADLARRCWTLFEMRGYARVDFRIDHHGRPWILEINANPCLAPDAGFAAALVRAGIDFDDAIARILNDSSRPTPLAKS